MKLNKLLESLPNPRIQGSLDIEISGIQPDSRKVEPGNLFVAIKGLTVDSHDFIPQVLEKGAIAIVGEKDPQDLASQGPALQGKTYIQVQNSREALGILAANWFDNPSKKLKVIGVTGTEGKTTTTNLIYHILKESGKKVGLISTITAKIGDEEIDTGLHVTNPEALPLQELLAKMVDAGCEYAILETTSMGLHQGRVAGVKYHVGVLTNIASDHMDYHKTVDAYKEAKAILFRRVKTAILNKDDSSYEYMKSRLADDCKLISYGIDTDCDLKANNVRFASDGTEFSLNNTKIKTSLLGNYNVSNTLAAIAIARELEIDMEQIKKALITFKTPIGRLERIDEGHPPAGEFSVFVDFAHTANSVDKVLGTLKDVLKPGKKLIALYGSAGGRDQIKRPAMGAAGAKYADITIFTTDDPREERVDDITNQLVEGALKEKAVEVSPKQLENKHDSHIFTRIIDRKEAIEIAISLAKEGDIVALLGKGHETSLAIGKEEIPWSDQEEARKILKKRLETRD